MLFTAGDIQATIGFFLGVALTSWATLLAFKLLFPTRVTGAAEALEQQTWKTVLIGAAFFLIVGLASVTLLGVALPIAKLVGMVMLGWLLAVSLVGAGGLTTLLARRIEEMGAGLSPFATYSRASLVLIGFCLLPLAGWFVFAPAILAVSAGAGWMVVMGRTPRQVAA
ncbi:hypothetical protein BH11ARM2_BH11ARM2_11270 [soil metagenome]